MARNTKPIDRSARQYIRITDEDIWDELDELMLLQSEKYKSFNSLIQDALRIGVPQLLREVKREAMLEDGEAGETIDSFTDKPATEKNGASADAVTDAEVYGTLLLLMKEIAMNSNLNKSILNSLFAVKAAELKGDPVLPEEFANGEYDNTPDFMEQEEMRGIKDLREMERHYNIKKKETD